MESGDRLIDCCLRSMCLHSAFIVGMHDRRQLCPKNARCIDKTIINLRKLLLDELKMVLRLVWRSYVSLHFDKLIAWLFFQRLHRPSSARFAFAVSMETEPWSHDCPPIMIPNRSQHSALNEIDSRIVVLERRLRNARAARVRLLVFTLFDC